MWCTKSEFGVYRPKEKAYNSRWERDLLKQCWVRHVHYSDAGLFFCLNPYLTFNKKVSQNEGGHYLNNAHWIIILFMF